MNWLQRIASILASNPQGATNMPNTTQGFGGANMFQGQQPTNQPFWSQWGKPQNPWNGTPQQMAVNNQNSMMTNPMIMDSNANIPNN